MGKHRVNLPSFKVPWHVFIVSPVELDVILNVCRENPARYSYEVERVYPNTLDGYDVTQVRVTAHDCDWLLALWWQWQEVYWTSQMLKRILAGQAILSPELEQQPEAPGS